MPSELSNAITSEQWERVVQICQTQPSTAKSWTTRHGLFEGIKDASVLPIHEALVAGAPYPIIEALLFAYPDCVYCKESSYQRLPLHCACRKNAQIDVVDLLLTKYADAALTADSLGRLPLHYALSNGANSQVIELLLKYRPNSARGFDKRGWTPLHVACGVGASTPVIERILNCYKEAVLMRTNKGSTAKQCLNLTQAPNKDQVKKLLKRAFSEVEGRYRPVQPPTSERVLV
ncbi:ankyrin repeat domain protein [Nitzschia inconspicua]|uniref:Ankyrin repeat domain protein n=1 Tax=Nitzschia inconspicua TaxID=303405 RepID=A0A9K3LQZ7_9STRA|nr:ankyrin repeat domain protein [Nitzschia inconspicua]